MSSYRFEILIDAQAAAAAIEEIPEETDGKITRDEVFFG